MPSKEDADAPADICAPVVPLYLPMLDPADRESTNRLSYTIRYKGKNARAYLRVYLIAPVQRPRRLNSLIYVNQNCCAMLPASTGNLRGRCRARVFAIYGWCFIASVLAVLLIGDWSYQCNPIMTQFGSVGD